MIKERNVRKRAPDHANNLHIIRFDLRIDSVPVNKIEHDHRLSSQKKNQNIFLILAKTVTVY